MEKKDDNNHFINLNYNLKQRDILLRKKAIGLIRRIMSKTKATSKKDSFWYYEVFPGPFFAYLENSMLLSAFIKLFTTSYYHMCGTCKMESRGGSDEDYVVNHNL